MRKHIIYLILVLTILSCKKDKFDSDRYLKIYETFDNEGFEAIQYEDNRIFILNSHLKRGETNSDYSGTDWNMELQEYGSKGEKISEKIFDNPYAMDIARDMSFTKSGDLLVTGSIQEITDFYFEQIRILKVTKQLEPIWEKTYGNINSADEGKCIIESNSNDIYIVGDGYFGAYLLKLNSQGDSLWTKIYDDMSLNAISETNNGEFLIGGQTYYNTNVDFLYKIDSEGDLIWKKGISEIDWPDGYGYSTVCYSIIPSVGDKFIISGFTSKKSNSLGNFIIEIDNEGNVSFVKVVEGGTHWLSKQVSATKHDNNYYLMGYYYGVGDEEGMQLLKIDKLGDIVWRKEFKDFIPNGNIIIENNNRLILAGEVGDISNRDIYLLKLDFNGDYE